MLSLNFTPFPILTTKRLLLRQLHAGDAKEIFFLRSDKRVMKYLDRPPAESLQDALDFIGKINTLEKNNEGITWAIAYKGKSTLIGTICFWNILKEHYRAETGYILHPAEQGKGIMQESMDAILEYGFNIMKLHSVEAQVNPENVASIKLLEKNDFIREGYFKENYFYKGAYLDTAVYSLLKS